ncbi:MAG: type II toxin-antitoxin system VapC family toxin [Bacteroidetes bacterium]|nr:MAG: type II toxin-antitoxin system VapC family toxin [Bacteroidota bacterium]
MEQPNYLIDTNIVIDYLGKKIPTLGMSFMNNVIDNTPCLSVVSKIEILGYNAPKEHYKLLTDFMDDSTVLDLNSFVVDESIEIRKKYKTKLPDAIIAATALVFDLTLITRNTKDFDSIQGLKLIDPWKI